MADHDDDGDGVPIDIYKPFPPEAEVERKVYNGEMSLASFDDIVTQSEQILLLLREETNLLEQRYNDVADSSADTRASHAAPPPPPHDEANPPPVPGLGRLSVEQRANLVTQAFENIRVQRESAAKGADRALGGLRASLEHADLRVAEARRDVLDLRREMGLDPSGDEFPSGPFPKAVTQAVRAFLEERAKERDAHSERLRLKVAAQRAQLAKLDAQQRSRGDLGEALQAIDFDQLKIENQQYLERIEEKNAELVKLKLTTGSTVHSLNSVNEQLSHVVADQQWLKQEIAGRETHLRRLQHETALVERERAGVARRHQALVQQHASVRVPKVSAYIALKVEGDALTKAVQNWRRKVEIADGQRKLLVSQLRHAAAVGLVSDNAVRAVGPAPKLERAATAPASSAATDAHGLRGSVPEEAAGGRGFLLPPVGK
eukprot:TRINITY_DN45437_c0_g1_i1.p1 TRINITY_DN45437_c0_g1~~TRINITY_DN45437_c0_g1_i1.p1  ORF type:complete len:462 (+),score=118.13 TRINITY_DN45437_c0_g1_i1:91-1386(+)